MIWKKKVVKDGLRLEQPQPQQQQLHKVYKVVYTLYHLTYLSASPSLFFYFNVNKSLISYILHFPFRTHDVFFLKRET